MTFSVMLSYVSLGSESDVLGSLEAVTGRPMSLGSSRRLPDWPDEGTDSSLRDAEEEYPAAPVTSITSRTAVGFGSSSKFSSPASRTPVGGPSPQGSFYNNSKGGDANTPKSTWKDLDKFYEDRDEEESEEEEESEDGDDGATETKAIDEKDDIDAESEDDDEESSSGGE